MKVTSVHGVFVANEVEVQEAKQSFFGLLKRGDKVYTKIIEKCDRSTLHAIIKDKTSTDSVINSDGWRGYTQGQASH